MPELPMTPNKPYLLRAMYEWLIDNHCTPYIVVHAADPRVQVPMQYVEDDRIILNIGPTAVKDLMIDNHAVYFGARFSGQLMRVYAPISHVLAIYARENGQGMVFGDEPDEFTPPPAGSDEEQGGGKSSGGKSKPNLRVVK